MVHCQIGDPARAVEAADTAALLSPLDPMLFAIFGARTFGLLRLGKTEEAAVAPSNRTLTSTRERSQS